MGEGYVEHCLQHLRDKLLAGFEDNRCKVCGQSFVGQSEFDMLLHAGFQHEVLLDQMGDEVFEDLSEMMEAE